MITAMKKYTFLVFHRDYEAFLTELREAGVVHVTQRAAGLAEDADLQEALRDGGRMFASAFLNYAWIQRRDRTFSALVQGTIQGRNAGFDLWRKSQAETSAMLDRIRKMQSQVIFLLTIQ